MVDLIPRWYLIILYVNSVGFKKQKRIIINKFNIYIEFPIQILWLSPLCWTGDEASSPIPPTELEEEDGENEHEEEDEEEEEEDAKPTPAKSIHDDDEVEENTGEGPSPEGVANDLLLVESDVQEVNPDNMQTLPMEIIESQWRLSEIPSEQEQIAEEEKVKEEEKAKESKDEEKVKEEEKAKESKDEEKELEKGKKKAKLTKEAKKDLAKTEQKKNETKNDGSTESGYQATLKEMPAAVWTTRSRGTKGEPPKEAPTVEENSVAIEALDSEEEKEKGQAFKDFTAT